MTGWKRAANCLHSHVGAASRFSVFFNDAATNVDGDVVGTGSEPGGKEDDALRDDDSFPVRGLARSGAFGFQESSPNYREAP